MMRTVPVVAAIALLILGASAQESCTSVVDTATDAGLTILLDAVQAAGLVDAVNDPDAGLTIFAPTNDAFAEALDALGLTAEELLADKSLLTEILTYHVVAQPLKAADFGDGATVTTLLGDNSPCGEGDLVVTPVDGSVTIEGGASSAAVEIADVEACTTVIHVIDSVLLSCTPFEPVQEAEGPVQEVEEGEDEGVEAGVEAELEEEVNQEKEECTSVVDTAKAAGLNTLLAAVEAADLVDTVNDPEAKLTIFAPTDEAFAHTLRKLDLTAEELLADKETLTQILLYHVLPEAKTAQELLEEGDVKTLVPPGSECADGENASNELVVRRSYFLWWSKVKVFGQGSIAKVKTADVKACSTVIHVINNVLLPCGNRCHHCHYG